MGELGAMIGRRQLLQTLATGWFIEQALGDDGHISGQIVGADHRTGHRLRGELPKPAGPSERADVVVVGSGVSGASAAWRLAAMGIDVLMLELEPFAGGTSSWGEQGVVPHPWGAHYLPVPESGARSTQRLLEQVGAITGWDAAGRPRFDDEMLCHAPEERLWYRGEWFGSLVPYEVLSGHERAEIERFRAVQQQLLSARGNDGREAFAIPVEHSSRDPQYLQLDEISMAEWLMREGFHSEFVRWYAEYGALDDFGASLSEVSAWAGLHYFASRKLETEQLVGSRYLVWPEGNGFLVRKLLAELHGERRHGALVTHIGARDKSGVEVHYLDTRSGETHRVEARGAIVATPAFIARRLLKNSPGAARLPQRASSPWVVANIHVKRKALPNRAWDSVIYGSPGLGYVDASHQHTSVTERTVLTYFRAYGERDAAGVRAQLLRKSWSDLASEALVDLSGAHPELTDQTQRIDVMIWGHAMPRPRPGFLGSEPFSAPVMLDRHIAWAHVDQTGFALFEEANLRGVRAAEYLATAIDATATASWL